MLLEWYGMGMKINKSFYTRQKNPGATKMLLAMLFKSSNGIVWVERERFVEGSKRCERARSTPTISI
jgi:hypothetical protein